jgi:DNA polymerase V
MKEHEVVFFSSNYVLYGDMSDRVMSTLSTFTPNLELYSIDEAFLDFSGFAHHHLEDTGKEIRGRILRSQGIPVSVGMASTKVLAKMANKFAKKTKAGLHVVRNETQREELLKKTPVADIWGIGPQYQKMLANHGFTTAFDLSRAPEEWMRKEMTVQGQRLLKELNGIPAMEWELLPPAKKNICIARGFGKLLTRRRDVAEALANYTAAVGEKLRGQKTTCGKIQVFLHTNAHRKEDRQYFRALTMELPTATNHSGTLIRHALKGLDLIFKSEYNYNKCGFMALGLQPENQTQQNLFEQGETDKQKAIMKAVDALNKGLGKDLVRLAAQGYDKAFKLRQAHLSRRYTTRMDEILKIKI